MSDEPIGHCADCKRACTRNGPVFVLAYIDGDSFCGDCRPYLFGEAVALTARDLIVADTSAIRYQGRVVRRRGGR